MSARRGKGAEANPAAGLASQRGAAKPGGALRPAARLPAGPRVGIVGPGRAGLGLALALRRARIPVIGVHGRREKAVPPGVEITLGPVPPWLADVDVVILAVGAVVAAPFGVRLNRRLPVATLRRTFSALLFLIGADLVWQNLLR